MRLAAACHAAGCYAAPLGEHAARDRRGAVGVVVAQWGGGLLRGLLLPDVEWTAPVLDPRVIVVTVLIALVAGLITGLAPMRQLRERTWSPISAPAGVA